MGNASSHIHTWFHKPKDDAPLPIPIFPKTIFAIQNEELGLCVPQQIAFKMPAGVPDMHFAEDDNELVSDMLYTLTVPRNFWPSGKILSTDIRIKDPKHLVHEGNKRKHVTLHLMRYTPRAMIPNMQTRIAKLQYISDFIITFMLYPEKETIGQISKQDDDGIKNGVLFQLNCEIVMPHQIIVYQNLLLNPSLISMSPHDFDEYVKNCTEVQNHVVNFGNKMLDLPHEFQFPQASIVVEKIGEDEMKLSWNRNALLPNDWIGIFRPYVTSPEMFIAKFLIKDQMELLHVKMYPVPYGDVVYRCFRGNTTVANSGIVSFGEEIQIGVLDHSEGITIEVSGDLPKTWSLSLANEGGLEVTRVRPENGSRRVMIDAREIHAKAGAQARVIAELWGDCLAVRSL
eukprot:Phypoly_transcript_09846.p1 GENE.Phypoly_transcript_09846~~Phypoly_transcript_09846.p1  ORF type:complete len:400 (+),score=38.92 Phypoly_transcript_09846:89-1288(+)